MARRDEDERYPVLLATVVEVLDEVVGLVEHALSEVENSAPAQAGRSACQRPRACKDRLNLLEEILRLGDRVVTGGVPQSQFR